ncbi:MAG: hypothetical protein ABSF77_01230 [Spirochaetia bacterium]|jgi:hypothetical protein
MFRKILSSRAAVPVMLVLQIAPLIVFPLSTFTIKSQEWWLPVLLTIMVIVAIVQILSRRTQSAAPWHLLSFAQGFNIISRLMMLLPHTTEFVGGVQRFNTDYVIITVVSMLFSALEIWYVDLPEVRNSALISRPGKAGA